MAVTHANGPTGQPPTTAAERPCPYLGLRSDPASVFLDATEEHRCRAGGRLHRITLEYQRGVCLTAGFETCPFQTALTTPAATSATNKLSGETRPRGQSAWGRLRTGKGLILGASAALLTAVLAAVAGLLLAGQLSIAVARVPAASPIEEPEARIAASVVGPDAIPDALPSAQPVVVSPTAVPEALLPPASLPQPALVDSPGLTSAVVAPSPPATATPVFGTVLLDAGFARPLPGWPDDPDGSAVFVEGAYRLIVRQSNHFVAVGIPTAAPLGDVVVTAQFRKVGGPPGGGYGIIVRDQSPESRDGDNQLGDYYVAAVGDRGEVGLWLRDREYWVDLVPWTHLDAVRPGTLPNELRLSAIGERVTLSVNEVAVVSWVGATLLAGGIGVFAGGDLNQVELQHLLVQSVP